MRLIATMNFCVQDALRAEEGVDSCGFARGGARSKASRVSAFRRDLHGGATQVRPVDVRRQRGSSESIARADETDHARRVEAVEFRRRPLSRACGNRDEPHLCSRFALE
jgi:hypothetical protein